MATDSSKSRSTSSREEVTAVFRIMRHYWAESLSGTLLITPFFSTTIHYIAERCMGMMVEDEHTCSSF